ncbi:MAG: hypothetical protein R3Y05_01445 [bacterium]
MKKQLSNKKISIITNEDYLKKQIKVVENEIEALINMLEDKEALKLELQENLEIVTGGNNNE